MRSPYENNTIFKIGRAYRHIGRLTEIVSIFVKFGFYDMFSQLGLNNLVKKTSSIMGFKVNLKNLNRPQRLRMALEELGLVFIKWGQYLSVRDDIIPSSYTKELSHLQNAVPPIPFNDVLEILKIHIEDGTIKELVPEPLGAASIGQVHSAKLANDTEVVIKIKRPGLEKQTMTDLEILAELALLAERHIPYIAMLQPVNLVNEFCKNILSELDFALEASNIDRFYRFYSKSTIVKTPLLYRDLSNDKIIVMEKIEGIKLENAEQVRKAGFNPTKMAKLGTEIVLDQIIDFGFFHADPHPGNILIMEDGRIGMIDFGLVGRINQTSRDNILNLALSLVRKNPASLARNVLKLTNYTVEPDLDKMATDMEVFIDSYLDRPLKDINLKVLFKDLMRLIAQYQLEMKQDLLLLTKAITQIEAIGIKLDPNFDIAIILKPIVSKLYYKRFTWPYWEKKMQSRALDAWDIIEEMPKILKSTSKIFSSGRIKIDMRVEEIENLRKTIDRSSYRLSFALVLASLIIGSSVVILSKTPPYWYGLPILGVLGFLSAGLVAFWLVIDLIKNKKIR